MKPITLSGPKLKIKRASEQARDISFIIQEAFTGDRYAVFCDVDPPTGNRSLKIKLANPLPDSTPLIAAELIYHLRSALDQMTVELARANGTDDKGVFFPFAGDAKEFYGVSTQRKIQKLAPADISAINALQPYKGGNDVLWALGRLSNLDKHIDLIPIGSVSRNTYIRNATFIADGGDLVIGAEPCGRLDDGIAILSVGNTGRIDFECDTQIHVTGDVILGDVDFFKGWFLIPTLHQLVQLVDDIIQTIEASHV